MNGHNSLTWLHLFSNQFAIAHMWHKLPCLSINNSLNKWSHVLWSPTNELHRAQISTNRIDLWWQCILWWELFPLLLWYLFSTFQRHCQAINWNRALDDTSKVLHQLNLFTKLFIIMIRADIFKQERMKNKCHPVINTKTVLLGDIKLKTTWLPSKLPLPITWKWKKCAL